MASDEATAVGAPVKVSADAVRPQLRLHHLFALTGVMAVLLGISGPQQRAMWGAQGAPAMLQAVFLVWGVVYAILGAIAITAFAYGIAWHRRGIGFFHQPGHWLLVDVSLMTMVGILPAMGFRLSAGSSSFFGDGDLAEVIMIVVGVVSFLVVLARVALNIYFGAKKCDTSRWSWVFYMKAVAALIQFFGDIVVLILLARAAAVDRRDRMPRDTGHWLGVTLQFVICLLVISLTAFFMAVFALGIWGS